MILLTEMPHLDELLGAADYSKRILCLNCKSHIKYVDYRFEELVRRGEATVEQIRQLSHEIYDRATKGKNIPLPCPHCLRFNVFNIRQGVIRVAKHDDSIVSRFIPDPDVLFMVDEANVLHGFRSWLTSKK